MTKPKKQQPVEALDKMTALAEKMCQCLEHLQRRGYTGWYEDEIIAEFRRVKPKKE